MNTKPQNGDNILSGDEAEKLFRQYEVNYLDQFYKSLPAIRRADASSAFYLLAAYDSLNLLYPIPKNYFGFDEFGPTKILEDGFIQACRWLAMEGKIFNLLPSVNRDAFKDATSMLKDGANYSRIADFHMMYGRGIVDVSINPEEKSVCFDYKLNEDRIHNREIVLDNLSERLDYSLTASRNLESDQKFVEIVPQIARAPHEIRDGRVIITDFNNLLNLPVEIIYRRLLVKNSDLIPEGTDLVGFCVEDLRIFWKYLLCWAFIVEILAGFAIKNGAKLIECTSTQVLYLNEMIDAIHTMSGLEPDKIMCIIDRLSYDDSLTNPDIILQPFLRSDKLIAWSTKVIRESQYERNLLKLMVRIDEADILHTSAVNIIGDREQSLLGELGRFLEKRGFKYKLRRKISFGSLSGDVDLLAWKERCANQVLLIEFKANLPPDEINEVDKLTDDLMIGREQIKKCITILGNLDNEIKYTLFKFVDWTRVTDYFGVVISFEGPPNSRYYPTDVPVGTFNIITKKIRGRDFKTPETFSNALRSQEWLDKIRASVAESDMYSSLTMNGITYNLPSFTID